MRLEPSAAVVDRYTTRDVELGGRTVPRGDLVRVSLTGANRDPAVYEDPDRFDPARGTPFAAFASPTILGELKRHFRDRVWTVRVPRGLHDRMAEVEKATSALTVELQRSPSVSEIAGKLKIEPAEVLEVPEANHNRRPLSLDRPVGGEDDESPASEWVGDEDEGYELIDDKLALEGVLPQLDDRERLILRLRFVEDMTQSQIAEQIGHSQMHVSRILRRTLERIREQVAEQEERG